jgi:hypothetical protein
MSGLQERFVLLYLDKVSNLVKVEGNPGTFRNERWMGI